MMESRDAVRSEFLFCYDARMSNPNGDPDENHPRIDPATNRNLVTDVRLKRTIREYLQQTLQQKEQSLQQKQQRVFITAAKKEDGTLKIIEELGESYLRKEKKGDKEVVVGVDENRLVKEHIDVRLFGLLFTVSGATFKRVGPVQFSIGQSLNQVETIPIRITRVVPTAEKAKAGTMGEKFILRYSFIVFHGFLNDLAARETYLSEDDVTLMVEAMWHGTTNLSTTSKYGQQSRLLLRLRYSQPLAYIGDLDRKVELSPVSPSDDLAKVEGLSQIKLDITRLSSTAETNASVLSGVDYIESPELVCVNNGQSGRFSEVFTKKVPLNMVG